MCKNGIVSEQRIEIGSLHGRPPFPVLAKKILQNFQLFLEWCVLFNMRPAMDDLFHLLFGRVRI
jgi:hypothetical protein